MDVKPQPTKPAGFHHYPSYFDDAHSHMLLEEVRAILDEAPLYRCRMPRSGKPLSVEMSNCGELGWHSDQQLGYRYISEHPVTGRSWPALPGALSALWEDVSAYAEKPEACLINYYTDKARMGLHVDTDEDDMTAPVVTVCLGDEALLRIGGSTRNSPTSSLRVRNGDVFVLGGEARRAYHGIDRIYPGSSPLLSEGGRFSLTLRRVTRPGS